tara:strand:+ start:8363 stop:8590 length:228 start_codon:yes stop_codon:yes gene_type:complete
MSFNGPISFYFEKNKGSRHSIFGITFKENCLGKWNTIAVNAINNLRSYVATVTTCDPYAPSEELALEYELGTTKH